MTGPVDIPVLPIILPFFQDQSVGVELRKITDYLAQLGEAVKAIEAKVQSMELRLQALE